MVDLFALAWMTIGVGLLWDFRSLRIEALALAAFTLPATFTVLLTPALVLILLNQG
jgi:hypothetical protein